MRLNADKRLFNPHPPRKIALAGHQTENLKICHFFLNGPFQCIPDIAAKTDLSGYTKDDHYTDIDCLTDDSDY